LVGSLSQSHQRGRHVPLVDLRVLCQVDVRHLRLGLHRDPVAALARPLRQVVRPDLHKQTDHQTDKQTNKQTKQNKTKQTARRSPAAPIGGGGHGGTPEKAKRENSATRCWVTEQTCRSTKKAGLAAAWQWHAQRWMDGAHGRTPSRTDNQSINPNGNLRTQPLGCGLRVGGRCSAYQRVLGGGGCFPGPLLAARKLPVASNPSCGPLI